MAQEIALFWLVLAGFLFADNLVLLPQGADYLRFGRRGRWRYEPRARLQLRGRDLVLLNPLNPFDRLALTRGAIGATSARQVRNARRQLRAGLPGANVLSWVGSTYLLLLATLALLSWRKDFGDVLLALVLAHGLVWVVCMGILATHRKALELGVWPLVTLGVHTLLVPGYLINLGKRVWRQHSWDLPALTLGLRMLKRMPDDGAGELYRAQMADRLDELAFQFDLPAQPQPCRQPSGATEQGVEAPGSPGAPHPPPLSAGPPAFTPRTQALLTWFTKARECLTTSAPPAG